uniref:Uncharacterized protein n=1 Tax=Zea mays TaxID=4577 RepID=A0A804M309_MAIZE
MASAPSPATVAGVCGGPHGDCACWLDWESGGGNGESAGMGAGGDIWAVVCGGGRQSRATGMGWCWKERRGDRCRLVWRQLKGTEETDVVAGWRWCWIGNEQTSATQETCIMIFYLIWRGLPKNRSGP